MAVSFLLSKVTAQAGAVKPGIRGVPFVAGGGGALAAGAGEGVKRDHDTDPLAQQDGISGTPCRPLRSRI
jgi:hypothetical protein